MISQFLLPLEISHWITAHIQPEATAWVTQSFNNCLHGKHTPTNELWEAWVNGLTMKEILQNWFTKANGIIITSKRPAANNGSHQNILHANYPQDRLSEFLGVFCGGRVLLGKPRQTSTPHPFCCQTFEVCGLATEGNVSLFPWFITPTREEAVCLFINQPGFTKLNFG